MVALLFRLSESLGLSPFAARELARTAWRRYKIFTVPKKNRSGVRTIAQPSRAVKAMQRWLLENELGILPIHDAATGYIKARGIKYNALAHLESRFLLKLDFADFFPSITPRDLTLHLNKYGQGRWDSDEIRIINEIVFWRDKRKVTPLQLCIGGPTSPLISNTVMFDFDGSVSALCKQHGVVYTRYADDLCFSTSERNVLPEIERLVRRQTALSEYPKITLNEGKTLHTSKARLRRVTGLVLTPESKVSIGRDRKRIIRAAIDHFSRNLLDNKQVQHLKGLLAFAHDVEPIFVENMSRKYGKDLIARILAS